MFGELYLVPMLIGLAFGLIGMVLSNRLKSRFKKYSQTQLVSGMSGKEVAEKMLQDHGITDVEILSTKGQLTDHYNPLKKTINLSQEVYEGRNAAAAAVAAHECGHAVQHAKKYAWLQFRSAIVPLQASAGMILNVVTFGAMFMGFAFSTVNWDILLWIIVAAYGAITLFSIVTLPVEFDASNRALAWMERSGIASSHELSQSKDALKWAASTYVIAALGALATLLYYASLLIGND